MRIRPQMGGFKEEMKSGVADAFTSVDAALSETAAGTTKVSAGFDQAAASARASVASFVETRNALQAQVVEYGRISEAAKVGSDEQIAAARLAADAQKTLARSYEETAVVAASAARKASTATKEAATVTETSMAKVKGSIAGIGAVGGLLAGGMLGKFVYDSAKDAASVQKSGEVIKATFGNAAQSVIDFADKGGVALGIAGHLTEGVSAKFGILFKNMGIGQGQAATMTLGLEKLGGSLAAIRGIDPAQALQSLNMAMLGNMRSLKQLGLSFSNAQILQEAMRLGIIKTASSTTAGKAASEALAIARAKLTDTEHKYAMNTTQVATAQKALEAAQAKVNAETTKAAGALTPATKAQAIYALATKNLGDYQAQAQAHAGDLANVQRRLSAEWDLAREKLGTALLPVISTFIGFLANDLPAAFSTVTGFMKRWSDIIAPMAGAIGAIVLALAAWKVGTLAWAAAQGIATAAMAALDAVMMANPFVLVALAIIGLVGALAVLYERSNTVRQAINAAWNDIKAVSEKVWGGIRTLVLDVWDVIKTVIGTTLKVIVDEFHVFTSLFTGNWKGAWDNVKKIFSDIWSGMSRIASDALDVIKTYVAKKAIEIGLAIIEPFTHIPKWLGGGWAQDMKKSMTDTLNGLQSSANAGGQNIGTSIVNGVQTGLSPLQSVVANAIQSSVSQSTAASPGRASSFTRGTSLGSDQIRALVRQAGGTAAEANYLSAISGREDSSGSTNVINDNLKTHDYSVGLFQINFRDMMNKWMRGGQPAAAALAKDPLAQAKYALGLLHSQGPSAWSTNTPAIQALLGGSTSGSSGSNGLIVGTSAASQAAAAKAAAAAQQTVAQGKASLEASLKTINASADKLGSDLTATIRKHLAAVRAEITGISSKTDVAKARLNLSDLSKEVNARLAQLKTEIALNNTFDGLKTQVTKLGTDVTPQIKTQMAAIRSEIGKVSTPQQIADVRRQMTTVKNEIAAQLKAIQTRIAAEKTSFDSAWQSLASGADSAFQRATTKALNTMQVTVTGAFNAFQYGGAVTQTPAELALQQLQDAKNALDQQAALKAAQDQLAADSATGSGATDAQILADKKAVTDAAYQIQVTALQTQATLERNAANKQLQDAQAAFQDQRTLLQQQMDQRVADIQTGMLNGSIAAAAGMSMLTDVLSDPSYGIDMQNSGLVIGGALYKGLNDGLKPVFDLIQKLLDDMRGAGLITGQPAAGGNLNGNLDPAIAAALRAAGKAIPGVTYGSGQSPDEVARALAAAQLVELQKQTQIAEDGQAIAISISDGRNANRIAKAVAR